MPQPTLIVPKRFGDPRGWFAETYHAERFSGYGIKETFVQDNEAFSAQQNTFRGLHFQSPPHVQGKIVRCVSGSIRDYFVDIRRGSPTFGHCHQVSLTAERGEMVFIPTGYAHAYLTTSANTLVSYKVTSFYSPRHEGGMRFDDPLISGTIDSLGHKMILNDRDRLWPDMTADLTPFMYDGIPFSLLTIEV